jgi:hypothetical protein
MILMPERPVTDEIASSSRPSVPKETEIKTQGETE